MDLMDYMPVFLVVLVALFLIPFFIYVIRGIRKNKKFDASSISLAKLPKRFEVLDGKLVVAIPGSLNGAYLDGRRSEAIIQAMSPGTKISDAEGNEYLVIEFLKWPSQNRHLFPHDNQYYLVFSIRALKTKPRK